MITCANLASLLLARAATRGHEIALRGALGASRGRVIRQLLTESAVLSASGLILGIVLARWSLAFLEQLVPPAMTLFTSPSLNGATLAVAAAVSVATGLLFGLAPALAMTRPSLTDALKGSGRNIPGGQRGRGLFVVAEVAMTLVLLVAAGLLLQTFYRMRYADLGVRPEGLLTLRTALPQDRYEDFPRRVAFYERVLDGVQRLPGVVSAGYTTSVPIEWKGGTNQFTIEGRAPVEGMAYDTNHRQVSEGYLKAIGTPLVRGRYFQTTDTERSMPVVIINQTMARKYWPGGDPVGQRIAIDHGTWADPWLTVVGVVGDVRQMGLDAPPRPEMYLPYRQIDTQPWFAPRDLVVRTTRRPDGPRRRHQAGCSLRRPGAAGLEYPHARRSARRGRGLAPRGDDAADGVRRLRAGARGRGDLRRDRLLRRAARTRDGRPHRARRAAARHPAARGLEGVDACSDGRPAGRCCWAWLSRD